MKLTGIFIDIGAAIVILIGVCMQNGLVTFSGTANEVITSCSITPVLLYIIGGIIGLIGLGLIVKD